MHRRNTIRWPRFKESLNTYAFASLQVIQGCFPNEGDYPTTYRWEWLDRSGGLHGEYVALNDHRLAVLGQEKELKKLPEYQNLLEVISQESKLSYFLNGYVVTNNMVSRIDAKSIIQTFLTEFFNRLEKSDDGTGIFEEFYSEFESALTRTEIEIQVLAHLHGLYSDLETFNLENDIDLKKLSLSELNKVFGDYSFYSDSNYTTHPYALISSCKYRRSIQREYPKKTDSNFPENEVIRKMYEILGILRLYENGFIDIDRIIITPKNWEIDTYGGMQGKSIDFFVHDGFNLYHDKIESFSKFYDSFKSSRSTALKKFRNAFRWLANSSTKRNDGDKFLDYMIVLESLYLEDRIELSYRLPLRVAYFHESEYSKRDNVFSLLRKAYKVRSEMIHDGIPLPTRLQIKSYEKSYEIRHDIFLEEIAKIVYKTIRRIVFSQGNGFPSKAEWDKLILSG